MELNLNGVKYLGKVIKLDSVDISSTKKVTIIGIPQSLNNDIEEAKKNGKNTEYTMFGTDIDALIGKGSFINKTFPDEILKLSDAEISNYVYGR
jgi:hypothetical protein